MISMRARHGTANQALHWVRDALTILSRLSRETESPEVVLGVGDNPGWMVSALVHSLRRQGHRINPSKNREKIADRRDPLRSTQCVNPCVAFPERTISYLKKHAESA